MTTPEITRRDPKVGPKTLDFTARVCILSAMPRRVLLALAGCVLFGALGWGPAQPGTSRSGRPPLRSLVADPRLLALERDNGCLDQAAPAPAPQAWPDWAAAHIAGGDVPPARVVVRSLSDAPQRRRRCGERSRLRERSEPPRALVVRPARRVEGQRSRSTPLTGIRGPSTGMMFIAAVTVDPEAREIYTVDNDIGDRMMVFPYDADGNVKPNRVLSVPHQAWGVSINPVRKEIAVSVEGPREIVVYAQDASGSDAPLRMIRGPQTGLGDPHGVFFDGTEQRDRRRQPRQPERPRARARAMRRRAGAAAASAAAARRRPLRRAVDHGVPGRGDRRRRAAAPHPGREDRPELADGASASTPTTTRSPSPTAATARSASSAGPPRATSRRSASSRARGPAFTGPMGVDLRREERRDLGRQLRRSHRAGLRAHGDAATSRPSGSSATRRPARRPSASAIRAPSPTTRSATRSSSPIESASRGSRRLPGWQTGTRNRRG